MNQTWAKILISMVIATQAFAAQYAFASFSSGTTEWITTLRSWVDQALFDNGPIRPVKWYAPLPKSLKDSLLVGFALEGHRLDQIVETLLRAAEEVSGSRPVTVRPEIFLRNKIRVGRPLYDEDTLPHSIASSRLKKLGPDDKAFIVEWLAFQLHSIPQNKFTPLQQIQDDLRLEVIALLRRMGVSDQLIRQFKFQSLVHSAARRELFGGVSSHDLPARAIVDAEEYRLTRAFEIFRPPRRSPLDLGFQGASPQGPIRSEIDLGI